MQLLQIKAWKTANRMKEQVREQRGQTCWIPLVLPKSHFMFSARMHQHRLSTLLPSTTLFYTQGTDVQFDQELSDGENKAQV